MAPLPQAVPLGICTRSVGRSAGGHYILDILDECAKAGCGPSRLHTSASRYAAISPPHHHPFIDPAPPPQRYAKTLTGFSDPRDALREAARQTNRRARALGLVCVVLDAFEGYEGLVDRARHDELVNEFAFWVELCGILGIEQIQIPASFVPADKATRDVELVVADLRELADIGLSVSPPVKIAYEPLGWSTHIKTWEQALDVCHRVGRLNIGLCLDTFHIASLLWGSPETVGGLREGGDVALKESLDRLRKISPSGILVYQLSDGTLLDPPMPESQFTEPDIPHLFAWSMHGRPFPGEGYFPVVEISEAIFATGFRGFTVMETFEDDAFSPRNTLLAERANRAVGSWVRLSKELGLAPFHPPTSQGQNKLGTCSVNIGHYEHHTLEDKLYACAAVGYQAIDLYEDDFLHYLSLQPGANTANLWEPSPAHLHAAKHIGDLCAPLGMEIICFQPLIDVEGLLDATERAAAVERVKNYFPFMRALRTNVTYITTNRRYDDRITGDVDAVAADLAQFADLAAAYARADGGALLHIGYEPLSWSSRINTFDVAWAAIARADRPNLGIVLDTYNLLAVEFADPYSPAGHGRLHVSAEAGLAAVRARLAELVRLVPGDKILVVQVADAALVDPKTLPAPTAKGALWTPDHEPPYRAWSTSHRLSPNEPKARRVPPRCRVRRRDPRHGVQRRAHALEMFNDSLFAGSADVVPSHARRSYAGIEACVAEAKAITPFW
ncbi:hypothetical protein JCM3770_004221 [Rhodotorula araucariae]